MVWDENALRGIVRAAIALLFLFPMTTDHGGLQRMPQTAFQKDESESLLKREETLFSKVMEHVKKGDSAGAKEAAEKYLREFPVGVHYYEVYRVFRANLTVENNTTP